MTATVVLGYGLALAIGLSLGLLGGGGAILTVPVLHYVLGYGVKSAVPMSLVVVGLTSGVGALRHWRGGTVNGRAALAFGPSAIAGALLGAELGLQVGAEIQLTVLALVILTAAVAMLLGPGRIASSAAPPRPAPGSSWMIALVGAGVGLVTGFVGV
ncbi:MAG: sulfite exporter TauE/SafE family protein, partial [Gemmatimonadales bacterium]|nr:sulfite exporter TauE/SafE family protein [Gemmatimonadales bacterium]